MNGLAYFYLIGLGILLYALLPLVWARLCGKPVVDSKELYAKYKECINPVEQSTPRVETDTAQKMKELEAMKAKDIAELKEKIRLIQLENDQRSGM